MIDKSVAIDDEGMAVVGESNGDRRQQGGVFVSIRTIALGRPVVAREEAVRTAICFISNMYFGSIIDRAYRIGERSRPIDAEQFSVIVIGIELEQFLKLLDRGLFGNLTTSKERFSVVISMDGCGEALWVSAPHHPVLVVALHPCQPDAPFLGSWNDVRASIVFG